VGKLMRGKLPTGKDVPGAGGKKGRSGRPPTAFKRFARALYDDPEVQAQITRVLRNHREKHFAAVLKALLPIVAASEDASLLADASKRTGLRIELVPAREPAPEDLVNPPSRTTPKNENSEAP